jgi:ubiquinone/menaquinone biosynthesis C-methylase UbiE
MTKKKRQKDIFLDCEGNEYYKRNKSNLHNPDGDKIIESIRYLSLRPNKVLEIGCSNGWRLSCIHDSYKSECYGIDPSLNAIFDGRLKYPEITLLQGAADSINFPNASFDTVIIGFCLYLCDREDLFNIAKEVDRVLSNNGNLILYDFLTSTPISNQYEHCENIESYKMDYAKMFSWNPEYTSIYAITGHHGGDAGYASPDLRVGVNVLKKNKENAYLKNPYKKL